jgi:hypothetical protein
MNAVAEGQVVRELTKVHQIAGAVCGPLVQPLPHPGCLRDGEIAIVKIANHWQLSIKPLRLRQIEVWGANVNGRVISNRIIRSILLC